MVVILLLASKLINDCTAKNPSFKVVALCFLIMIGFSLITEGFQFKILKGYIYLFMAFAFLVDVIQIKSVKN